MIERNIAEIQIKIQSALALAGLKQSVDLLAVTKQVDLEPIRQALRCGLTHLGENKLQEAQGKFVQLADMPFKRHMIGHLQSNKVRAAVDLFDVIQSVDSVSLLQKIDRVANASGKVQNVLIQIKLSSEPSKFGLAQDQLPLVLDLARALPGVKVLGLMAMAPQVQDAQQARPYFARARRLFDQFFTLPGSILSMGMSDDFAAAVAEGSTMVRLGSAIFGSRVYPQ